MAGLFKKLLNLGTAYLQHVTAVRNALALPEAETVAPLSSYVTGLSNASFVGFKITIAGLAAKETDSAVKQKQKLQWVVAKAHALRLGQVETAPALAAFEPERELSFDAALDLIDSWFPLPQEECRAQLHWTRLGSWRRHVPGRRLRPGSPGLELRANTQDLLQRD